MSHSSYQDIFNKIQSTKNNWLIVFFQEGEGCDYSIGCGISTSIVEMNDEQPVIEQLKKFLVDFNISEEVSPGVYKVKSKKDEVSIDFALLVKIENFRLVDIDKDLRKYDLAYWNKKSEEEKLAAEVAEFERLKAKLGK